MNRYTTIELQKQDMHFSAAHFTIFSATERERLHGHNFYVAAEVTGLVQDDGLCFDYVGVKKSLRDLCKRYDEYTLLPKHSAYLDIQLDGDYYRVSFDSKVMFFLEDETLLLPVHNVTIEELADMLLQELLSTEAFMSQGDISRVVIKVSSGPGQWGCSVWQRDGRQI